MKKELMKSMIQEHELIETLLDNFERQHNKNPSAAKKIFRAFVWNLEKHIFLEEKIFYSVYSVWNENIGDIFEVLRDHGDILLLVKKIQNSDFSEEDLSTLKNLIKDHFITEEMVIYPKLERELDEEQRTFFLERSNDILIA